jgi:hypothetical protein
MYCVEESSQQECFFAQRLHFSDLPSLTEPQMPPGDKNTTIWKMLLEI